MPHILVTGGAGFIGGNFVLRWLSDPTADGVVNVDKLTYAGHRATLAGAHLDPRHRLLQLDICDFAALQELFGEYRPRAVVHFAAESHVDRSIQGPAAFIQTNLVGTFTLLDVARAYWHSLDSESRAAFRFLHVSTDEVFGSLGPGAPRFSETTPYRPNSPYSASKAGADHLVRAYHHTYGLPVITANCSNGYGPYQFPEKLIPKIITNALAGKPLPLYGDGLNVRDWLFVGDLCSALCEILANGRAGESYNVGGGNERSNLQIAHALCDLLDELRPKDKGSYREQIRFVEDRPGHDRRYAVDAGKIRRDLGWEPKVSFDSGLRSTVQWFLDNPAWVQAAVHGEESAGTSAEQHAS
ncbi:dTDP-glucose 4,6-dehydratase [Ralstonia psammae]|uniref:dTDP-glucose 4,6-dehydratase n=1 Tax=Ralstonia psammae TaxID=3058598 RepID=A0ABM9IXZ4_9RALS|nr:dTDP-glucose 4,6-dehydratase [Ralstonia sp. LMG 19083]CAJ0776037.1 dTDP-glucose 4,6-dehydratase [Ralstonia sp. LMG 19083]